MMSPMALFISRFVSVESLSNTALPSAYLDFFHGRRADPMSHPLSTALDIDVPNGILLVHTIDRGVQIRVTSLKGLVGNNIAVVLLV